MKPRTPHTKKVAAPQSVTLSAQTSDALYVTAQAEGELLGLWFPEPEERAANVYVNRVYVGKDLVLERTLPLLALCGADLREFGSFLPGQAVRVELTNLGPAVSLTLELRTQALGRPEEQHIIMTIEAQCEAFFAWEFSGPRILAGVKVEDAARKEELLVSRFTVGLLSVCRSDVPLLAIEQGPSLGVMVEDGYRVVIGLRNMGALPQDVMLSLLFDENELSEGAR